MKLVSIILLTTLAVACASGGSSSGGSSLQAIQGRLRELKFRLEHAAAAIKPPLPLFDFVVNATLPPDAMISAKQRALARVQYV